MSTLAPTKYPIYIKRFSSQIYGAFYRDYDKPSSAYGLCYREPKLSSSTDGEEKIGSIIYYTTLPPELPETTQTIYTLTGIYVEQTTNPNVYIFYQKFKHYAIITLDNPDDLINRGVLRVCDTNASIIKSTTAAIINCPHNLLSYEQNYVTFFDTLDRIFKKDYSKNITLLDYNGVLKEDLLPPDRIVWNVHRFCKYSEADVSNDIFLIDENALKLNNLCFLVNKKTNKVNSFIIKNNDFMDIVAEYLDDDFSDSFTVINSLQKIAYNDTNLIIYKTYYYYKGEIVNE